MSMEAPKPSKAFNAHSGAFEVRQNDGAGISDDDVLNVPAAIDEDPDLPVYFARDLGEMPGKFLSHDLAGMNAPLVKLLQSVDLALFQTLQIAFDTYSCLPPGSLLLTQQHDLTSKDETPHARVE